MSDSPNADAAPGKRRRGRPLSWTADVDAVIQRMSGAGYSDAEIAKHIERPISSVFDRRRALGLHANKGMRRQLCRLNLRRALVRT